MDHVNTRLDERGNNVEISNTKINIIGIQVIEEVKYYTEAYKKGNITGGVAQEALSKIEEKYEGKYKEYIGAFVMAIPLGGLEKYIKNIQNDISKEGIDKLNEHINSLSKNQNSDFTNLNRVKNIVTCIIYSGLCALGDASKNLEDGNYIAALLDVGSLAGGGVGSKLID